MRNMHNIQDNTIVEDMVRNLTIIYVSLDNNQEHHQLNMAQVEGGTNRRLLATMNMHPS